MSCRAQQVDSNGKLEPKSRVFQCCEAEENQFYGVVCGQGGIQPDPYNISALKQMSAATGRQKSTLL